MVLPNIECWAHGGIGTGDVDTNASANDFDMRRSSNRGVDLFNPSAVSHISSNGYYGFSHINNLEQGEQFNDNNNNNEHFAVEPITESSASVNPLIAERCKKRLYPGDSEFERFKEFDQKRCRFVEEEDLETVFSKDFFTMPGAQIKRQSYLMDTEDHHHHNQPQFDPQVFFNEVSNGTQQQNTVTAQVAEQQEQTQLQQQHHQQPQHHHHQHNQHYQGHLHRANRDVSRCMMSHMI